MGDASKGEDPELVRTFVHEVTPVGFQGQLTDALAEAVRFLARSLKHDEVYTCRSLSPAQVTSRANAKAGAAAKAAQSAESSDHSGETVGGAEEDESDDKGQIAIEQSVAMLQTLNKQFNPQVD
jgi:hypothetical protein